MNFKLNYTYSTITIYNYIQGKISKNGQINLIV